jgi:hypothetical protein
VHRWRLVDPPGDRLEVVDGERPRVEVTVPADHVERVVGVDVPRPTAPVPDQHLDVGLVDQQRRVRSPDVPLAVRRVLQELAWFER